VKQRDRRAEIILYIQRADIDGKSTNKRVVWYIVALYLPIREGKARIQIASDFD